MADIEPPKEARAVSSVCLGCGSPGVLLGGTLLPRARFCDTCDMTFGWDAVAGETEPSWHAVAKVLGYVQEPSSIWACASGLHEVWAPGAEWRHEESGTTRCDACMRVEIEDAERSRVVIGSGGGDAQSPSIEPNQRQAEVGLESRLGMSRKAIGQNDATHGGRVPAPVTTLECFDFAAEARRIGEFIPNDDDGEEEHDDLVGIVEATLRRAYEAGRQEMCEAFGAAVDAEWKGDSHG